MHLGPLHPKPGGFTLVEVLIATVLFASILVALNGAFYGAIRLQNKVSQSASDAATLSRALNLLERDLRSALPGSGTLAGPLAYTSENLGTATSGRLEFFTASAALRDVEPWGDVQKVSYYLAESLRPETGAGSGLELVRGVTRNVLSLTEELPEEQWLLGGLEQFQILFFDGTDWVETWPPSTEVTDLPQAVKVRLAFAPAEESRLQSNRGPSAATAQRPVELVVPMLIQASTNQSGQSAASGAPNNPGSGNNNPGVGGANPGAGTPNPGSGNSGGNSRGRR